MNHPAVRARAGFDSGLFWVQGASGFRLLGSGCFRVAGVSFFWASLGCWGFPGLRV